MTVNGHNNTVAFLSDTSAHSASVNGHNNVLYSEGNFTNAHCNNLGRLENLIVQGHNNRFENLIV
jgi:hypothetical protein